MPRSSCAQVPKRSPRKSASLKRSFWSSVPIPPSRIRMRCASSGSNRFRDVLIGMATSARASSLGSPDFVAMVEAMPSRLELNDRFIHCIVSEALVKRYRNKMDRIAGRNGYWNHMETIIDAMINGQEMTFGAHGVMRTVKEGIVLPNGMKLNYRGIERSDSGDATYFDGRQRTKIYGALLTENVTQCLHRLIVSEQMLEIADAGIKVVLWPYDEVVVVVPEEAAELALQFMVHAMGRAPAWAAGLPLMGEGGIGSTYAEAK